MHPHRSRRRALVSRACNGPSQWRTPAIVGIAAIGLVLGAGGASAHARVPATPPPRAAAAQANPTTYTQIVKSAIVDIQAYWSQEFPKIYGAKYIPIGPGKVIAAHPGDALPPVCGPYSGVQENAFYCPEGDLIEYDDAGLIPRLAHKYGSFSVALVLAHEWGHAIQNRSNNYSQTTILKEQQADCFSGAWVQRVASGKAPGIKLRGGELDAALPALLELQDPITFASTDPQAHGNAFDRVRAVQDGFDGGAAACKAYLVDKPPLITEVAFTPEQQAATNNGNLPEAQVIPVTVDLLNDFYRQVYPTYQPMTVDKVIGYDLSGGTSQLPKCGGSVPPTNQLKNRVFYCLPDKYFGYDRPYVDSVYSQIGDFGVSTLFANAWATYVETLQNFPGVGTNADNAVLGADCYTGGFASAIWRQFLSSPTLGGTVVFSPHDLNKTIQAILSYDKVRGVPATSDVGFKRLDTFKGGFLNGYDSCSSFAK